MKSIFRALFVSFLVNVSISAQISQGGTPYSIENANKITTNNTKRKSQAVTFTSINNEAEKKRADKLLDPINSGVTSLATYEENSLDANFFHTVDLVNSKKVYFTDISTPANKLTNWSWNFGDGTTSTEKNPIHIFPYAGSFTISLSVSNGVQVNKIFKFIYVYSNPSDNLNATFTTSANSGRAPVIIDFTNSAGNITGWKWTISPSTGFTYVRGSANTANMAIQFTNAGTYTIKLQVTNGISSKSSEKSIVVTSESTPLVDFSWPSKVYAGSQVTFINKSFYTCVSYIDWNWTFPNGESSFAEQPVYVFSFPGTYNVSLCLKDECGNNVCTSKKITVLDPTDAITSYFIPDRVTIRKGETIKFYDRSFPKKDIVAWAWYFELDKNHTHPNIFNQYPQEYWETNTPSDYYNPKEFASHTYNKAGIFKVRLYAKPTRTDLGSIYEVLIEVKDTPELKPGFEFKNSANYSLSDDIIATNNTTINIYKKVGPNNWVPKEIFSSRYARFLGTSLKKDKLLIKLTRTPANILSYAIIEGVGEREVEFVDLFNNELPSKLFSKPLKDPIMDINNFKEVIIVQNEITGAYMYFVSNGNVTKIRLKYTVADIGRVFIDDNSIVLHIDKSIIIYERKDQNWDFTKQKEISGPFAAIGYANNNIVASAPTGESNFINQVATIFTMGTQGWITNQSPSAKLYIQDDEEIKNSLSFSIPDINSIDVAEKYIVVKLDLVNGSKSLRRKFIFKRFSNFWSTSKQSFKVSDVKKNGFTSNTSNYDFLNFRESSGLMTIYDYENYCNLDLYDQPTFTIRGDESDTSKGVIALGGVNVSSFDSGAKARYFGKSITLKPGLTVKSGSTVLFKSVAACDDLYK